MNVGNATRPAPGAWRLSWTLGRPEFGAALALALATHLIIFFSDTGSSSSLPATSLRAAMQVRMLRQDEPPAVRQASDSPVAQATPPHEVPAPVASLPVEDRAPPGPLPSERTSRQSLDTPRAEPIASSATSFAAASPANAASPVAKANAGEATLPPAPDYLFASKLDSGPRPLDDITVEYPSEGQLQEGTVTLRLLISDTGHVDDVAVVRSYPPGLFDRAAIEAFAVARFAPATLLGVPSKSQFLTEVHFAPFNRGARVSGRGY